MQLLQVVLKGINMGICKHLNIEDVTSYHGDVFDHPDYEYFCEIHKREVIPFLVCNEKRCRNYKEETVVLRGEK